MKHHKNVIVFGTVFLMMTAVFGCGMHGSSDGEEEQLDVNSLISVGFSQIGSESLWRDANSRSVQDTLNKEHGYYLIFNNARQKQENQIKAIRSFISQRVDYIVFSPVTEDGWETVLMEAKEAQIPVIVVDRKVAEECSDLYTAWVGSDSREEGIKAGEWLENYLEENGREDEEINIVMLTGTLGSSAQIGRSEGFHLIADTHENWHITAEESADFTTAKAREVMRELLAEQTEYDVLISQNDDMTFGALEAMQEYDIEVGEEGAAVISFDAAKKALQLVKSGDISVDIECNALLGPYIDEVIQEMEAGEEIKKEYIVEEEVFTKENVDAAIENRLY